LKNWRGENNEIIPEAHKRLSLLEQQRKQPDFRDAALSTLTNSDLDAFKEFLEPIIKQGFEHEEEVGSKLSVVG
jgi:hypothetical protein